MLDRGLISTSVVGAGFTNHLVERRDMQFLPAPTRMVNGVVGAGFTQIVLINPPPRAMPI